MTGGAGGRTVRGAPAGRSAGGSRPGRGHRPGRRRPPPGREAILEALVRVLEPLDFVHALWESGAISWGRFDRFSDLDLCVDADDERVEEVFPAVERALRSVAPLEVNYRMPFPSDHPYQQAFCRLRGTPPYLLVDLAVFRHSADDKYVEPETHGPPRLLFDKPPGLAIPRLDRADLAARAAARLERHRMRHTLFACFIEKEIRRGNWIEAIGHYRQVLVEPLMELLRMRHHPVHFGFGIRYVHQELPRRVLRRLQPLFFVRDEADLRGKARRAERWLLEEFRAADPKAIERG